MKQYIGTKIIQAEPATQGQAAAKRIGLKVEDCPFTLAGMKADGYRIIYADGYESWSPKDVFEASYRETSGMSFGLAIEAAKMGKKIARAGWNGKNQYVELASCISYKNSAGEIVNVEHDAIGNKALAFVGTSGVQMGWLASQADMLADDWKIVE